MLHCVIDWADRVHQDEEANLMEISQNISRNVAELTAKGAEFYPFKQEHIMEFFGSMLPHHEMMLQIAIETPNANFCEMIRNWISMYWEGIAEKHVIQEMEADFENHHFEKALLHSDL